jgi:hypothetical protein
MIERRNPAPSSWLRVSKIKNSKKKITIKKKKKRTMRSISGNNGMDKDV